MSAYRIDHTQVRRAFARAAASYEQNDALQRTVQSRLLERLDYYEGTPRCVLDVGCGTGRGAAILKRRWPQAQVLALDIALPMLQLARRHGGWMKPFERVCADALRLPLSDRSVDVLHSSLCIQWFEDPLPLFTEFARVLKPDGFLALTTLGPDTLREQPDLLRALDVRCNGRRHPGQLVLSLARDARLLVEDVDEIDDAQAHERHHCQRQSYA